MVDLPQLTRRFPGLVADLSSEQLYLLVEALQPRALLPGEVVVEEGQAAGDLCLLWEGALTVRARGHEIGALAPGALFGEVAWTDGGTASATLVAAESSSLLVLSREKFAALRSSSPRLASVLLRAVCRTLAARLRVADARMDQATGHGVAPAREGLFQAFLALFRPVEA